MLLKLGVYVIKHLVILNHNPVLQDITILMVLVLLTLNLVLLVLILHLLMLVEVRIVHSLVQGLGNMHDKSFYTACLLMLCKELVDKNIDSNDFVYSLTKLCDTYRKDIKYGSKKKIK